MRRLVFTLVVYLTLCCIGGISLADGALHPARNIPTQEESDRFDESLESLNAREESVSISAADSSVLRGWIVRPGLGNGDAVLLLHGLGDNRLGMRGYAQLLLTHGFTVLMPDARAHGTSGGDSAAYGLLERHDIRLWTEFLQTQAHPRCIYGMGESMGAAELLQSLDAGSSFCAVVAESPFSNFREIAYDRMGQPFHLGPWVGRTVLRPVVEFAFLRARWKYGLDMQQVSPEAAVAKTPVPVLLIHGQIDGNIPVRHSRRIHAHAPQTTLWEVPEADHCGAMSTDPQEFQKRVLAWFGDSANQKRRLANAAESLDNGVQPGLRTTYFP